MQWGEYKSRVLYDKHWTKVAERISNEALDNQINFIKIGGKTKPGGGF